MLKQSATLGTCILAILLAPSEGASQATFKPMDRLKAIHHWPKVALISQIASEGSHTVTSGETLWGISRKYSVSFSELATLNGLPTKDPVLKIGQKLNLPKAKKKKKKAAPPSKKQPTSYQTHQVESGDTFFRIARKHGVSVSALKEANASVNPAALSVGQAVRVPSYGKPSPPPVKTTPVPEVKEPPKEVETATPAPEEPIKRAETPQDRANLAPEGFGIYTTQPGDTTAFIAKKYGISREEFLRINKKSSYPNFNPRPGEFLLVPTDGSWYVPEPSQSQAQTIRTPNPLLAPPANPLRNTGRAAPSQARKQMLILHNIRANDSLEDLAKRFGTTTDQIRLDNPGIQRNTDLKVGTNLKIRTQSTF